MATPEEAQLLESPALAPPPGVIPNFIDPQDLHQVFLADPIICVTTSTLIVAMRMYAKFCITRKRRWEDYTCFLGYILWIGFCVPTSLVTSSGGAVHQWDLQLQTLIHFFYLVNTSTIIYGFAIFFIKLSILLQYLAIFAPSGKASLKFWEVQIVIYANFLYHFITRFLFLFGCTPRKKYWEFFLPTGHCFDVEALNIATGVFNVASDFVIILLPQPIIWKLRLPLQKRIGISAVFCTGIFACMASIFHLYYAVRLQEAKDMTYNTALMGFWTFPEMTIGIICSSLPVLPKFFRKFQEKKIAVEIPSRMHKFLMLSKDFRSISIRESASLSKTSRDRAKKDHTTLDQRSLYLRLPDGIAPSSDHTISSNILEQSQASNTRTPHGQSESKILRAIRVETTIATEAFPDSTSKRSTR